jgi:hypothetical protein
MLFSLLLFTGSFGAVIGDIHYVSFDGQNIDYQTPARVLLSKSMPTSDLAGFEVRSESVPLQGNTNYSRVGNVEIIYNGILIQMIRNISATPPATIYFSVVNTTSELSTLKPGNKPISNTTGLNHRVSFLIL